MRTFGFLSEKKLGISQQRIPDNRLARVTRSFQRRLDVNLNPSGCRAVYRPFSNAGVPIAEVDRVSIVDIRQSGEPSGKPLSHILLANISRPKRCWASRHLKHTIIGEETHDPVEVMIVKNVHNCLQHFH